MPRVLCLDTEPETIASLKASGHQVDAGSIGYRNGICNQPFPPHEYDAVVCDLKKPACFNSLKWGPGKNSNTRFIIEPTVEDTIIKRNGEARALYQLVQRSQMRNARPNDFQGSDVLTAVYRAGTHVLLFFNREWVRHLNYEFPDWVRLGWGFSPTVANLVNPSAELVSLLPEALGKIGFQLPLNHRIDPGPIFDETLQALPMTRAEMTGGQISFLSSTPMVINRIGNIFGQALPFGKGTIWALPQWNDNAAVANLFLSKLNSLNKLLSPEPQDLVVVPSIPAPKVIAAAEGGEMRDVFISHAHEDKDDIARPLAKALIAKGLTVWFDEFELKLGDSLRQKMEEGLRISRHGLVILSSNFFAKQWPQRELNGLFQLEDEKKRIMPVWHNLSADDVRKYSPIMADKYAISTSKGVAAIVEEVVKAAK